MASRIRCINSTARASRPQLGFRYAAKTIKGYGLGAASEASNVSHQQQELSAEQLCVFGKRFDIPLSDDQIEQMAFCRPDETSDEIAYLKSHRKELGGFLPARNTNSSRLRIPGLDGFSSLLQGTKDRQAAMTMMIGRILARILAQRILAQLLEDKNIGQYNVPITPDEARTFGHYREAKDGQVLQEGITEAGAMSSFIAAGTSYAHLQTPLIPFYLYYSMFGFQRIGDFIWAAADSRVKGFLIRATSGRTTLEGEGFQHCDGHGPLVATTIPTLPSYDPAYGYELAVIIQDGLRRMHVENEDIFYYITGYNEVYSMPEMPEGAEAGFLMGMY
ncbi:Pyruvate dehydrogenase E1 component [Novipirellula aureliae]|uniref:Pyruvate dehydrogenase E1 component n=1 Tax=Novipirellula aureliae TaxID=2527966 RepID=A0A5C6DTT1_9BACT|nr:hypothetical protein [Novipirellula aureliae]TWU40102.1 Pyruvate dehydrogenase E1 component [Novipirellula aureliae]